MKFIPYDENDFEWLRERDKKFKYHVTLTHKPTGNYIEQAGERCWQEAEHQCREIMKWRLRNWAEYQRTIN